MSPDTHALETARLAALDRTDLLDTPPEESFDRITRLTRRVMDVPMSTISLIDGHRQWFKSRSGVAACETPRGPAFCAVAIRGEGPLVVPDTLADERFRQNPYVTGEPHLRFYAGIPLRTPDGHAIGTLCAVDTRPRAVPDEDVAALSDLAGIVMTELELRALATTDGLTGALSRRAFREEAGRTVALALRHRHDLACILLDVDRFKAVNDTHGHAAGDLVLAEVAEACRSQVRRSDLLGRIGGEEFAILLPRTGLADALLVAEKVRGAIERRTVLGPSGLIAVSASFGVAALDRSAADLDALLQRADGALYVAKRDGRNRCRGWEPAEPPATLRRRVFKGGRITFNGGRSTIDCTVRSLSDTGAGLDIISAAGVPERFKLQIEADGVSRLCRIAEKRDRHLEVAFE